MVKDTGAIIRMNPFRPMFRRLLFVLLGKPVHLFPVRRIHGQARRQIPVVDTLVRSLRHQIPAIECGLELSGARGNAGFQLFVYCEQGPFCLPALFDFQLERCFRMFQLSGASSE